ncbi:heavy metal translocating P-type ATPase [Paucibacter sp. DJ2R-2]|uniref:heavy metal translocating P-type ATPase n=1 Tax=Paucibacter sp. DJ2R-2 TaxID=2893558 RepID=UPI0021E3F465|nr:cation-translocating P-type ATPase [Paucibacter sp. DJ2R-2]MCV2422160.1 cation-translocating P-type ATPase [Paucibacter sp. DJ4R-1]MCV2440256.1 cation-translocating P-type ATPase [Paucibacter sp. DJ2R-2]
MTSAIASLPTISAAVQALDDPDLLAPFTRWLPAAPAEASPALAESQFQLSGLHCAACAGIIERALQVQPGVVGATVNAASARLTLRWRPEQTRLADLLASIERSGYGAAPDVAAPARALREREQRQAVWRLFVAAFLMMQVMMMAAPAYFAEPGDLSPDLARLLQWASWVLSLPVLLFSAGPFFRGAWLQLRARRLGMDVPVALGLAVTFVASSGALFEPGGVFGHEVYFDSLTMFVSFLLAGRWLELRARHRAAASLEAANSALPDAVERIEADGSVSRVAPMRLRVGDLVRVLAGQAFPADGRVEGGSSAANEALLSGESLPVAKAAGDEVVAASLNLQAPLLVRISRVGADTRHEAIQRLMREAMSQRPASIELADRVAGYFLWAVLLLAGAAAMVWSVIEPGRAVWVAVSVLIVTCPCALSLAAPAARLAATGALARRGLLLVNMDLLETLCKVDTVVLDKTGTLTEDRMALLAQAASEPAGEATLLAAARSLARQSQHPFSRALVQSGSAQPAAEDEIVGGEPAWQQVQESPGRGLQAQDAQGRVWRLGAPAWVASAEALAALPERLRAEAQLAFGQPEGQVLLMQFGEVLRADACEAVQQLHALGLNTCLLSGDAPERAEALARQAGLQRAVGGASPERKLAEVQGLQEAGHCVLMVGDGINDAPVLARADASVVMGQGAMLARASADALLLSGRLMDLVLLRRLALRTRRIIRQNLAWAAAYNAACIPLALTGYLPPWAAGLGMAGSSVWVVLNAQRLARNLSGR